MLLPLLCGYFLAAAATTTADLTQSTSLHEYGVAFRAAYVGKLMLVLLLFLLLQTTPTSTTATLGDCYTSD